MADTYTTSLRLTKPEVGANLNTWGTILNEQLIDLLDTAIAGATTITVAANVVLTSQNGQADQARAAALILNGSPSAAFTVTLPAVTKWYLVQNNTGQTATIRYATGTTHAVLDGETQLVFADGTNVVGLSAAVSGAVAQATNALQLGGVVAANYARRDAANAFSAGQSVTTVALTDAATITVNCALGNVFRVTLAGNRTLAAPTNPVDGKVITIKFKQDAGGNRTIAWPANFLWQDGEAPVLSTAVGAEDVLTAVYYASDASWYANLGKGFA